MTARELNVDKQKAGLLRRYIDWCQYQTIRRYVDTPGTKIDMALIVDSSLRLEDVATIACSGDVAQWKDLLKAGLVQPAVQPIPAQTNCHVIYMPPAYLVQLLD